MSEIPKDIADIASRLASRAISMNLSPSDAVAYVVREAVMEERERCAKVVEAQTVWELPSHRDIVAGAIRKGTSE